MVAIFNVVSGQPWDLSIKSIRITVDSTLTAGGIYYPYMLQFGVNASSDFGYDLYGQYIKITNNGPGKSTGIIYGSYIIFSGDYTKYNQIVGQRLAMGLMFIDTNMVALQTDVDGSFASSGDYTHSKVHIFMGGINLNTPPGTWGIVDDRSDSWFSLIYSGVCQEGLEINEDFTGVTWGTWGNEGVQWRYSAGAMGSIEFVNPSLDGSARVRTQNNTPTFLDKSDVLMIECGVVFVLTTTWKSGETANTMKCNGFTSAVDPVNNQPYVAGGNALLIMADTDRSPNFLLFSLRDGAVYVADTQVPIDTSYHKFILRLFGNGAGLIVDNPSNGIRAWLDNTQIPIGTRSMQFLPVFVGNRGGATDSNMYIKSYKFNTKRYTLDVW